MTDQQSLALLTQAMEKNAGSTKAQISSTDDWIMAQARATGISHEQLIPAYTALVDATHNASESQALLTTAMNISAGRHIALASVTQALMRASNGVTTSLGRYGIQVKNTSKVTETASQIWSTMVAKYGSATIAGEKLGVVTEKLKITKSGETQTALSGNAVMAEVAAKYGSVAGAASKLGISITTTKSSAMTFAQVMASANKTYGGDAAKAAHTTAGALAILQENYLQLKEGIGKALLPVINDFIHVLMKVVGVFEKLPKGVQVFIAIGLGAAVMIGGLIAVIGSLVGSLGAIVPVITAINVSTIEWTAAFIAIAAIAYLVITHWKEVTKVAEDMWHGIDRAFHAIEKTVVGIWNAIVSVTKTIWDHMKEILKIAAIGLLIAITGPFGLIVIEVIKHWKKVESFLSGSIKVIESIGKNIMKGLLHGIEHGAESVLHGIEKVAHGIDSVFHKVLGIFSPSTVFHEHGLNTMLGFQLGAQQGTPGVNTQMQSTAIGALNTFKNNLSVNAMAQQGKGLMLGLISGIK
jgi:hypothetical protein